MNASDKLPPDAHRVRAINPYTGDIQDAVLWEDWFGPRRDAIRFGGLNSPYFLADNIQWEFPEERFSDAVQDRG